MNHDYNIDTATCECGGEWSKYWHNCEVQISEFASAWLDAQSWAIQGE